MKNILKPLAMKNAAFIQGLLFLYRYKNRFVRVTELTNELGKYKLCSQVTIAKTCTELCAYKGNDRHTRFAIFDGTSFDVPVIKITPAGIAYAEKILCLGSDED